MPDAYGSGPEGIDATVHASREPRTLTLASLKLEHEHGLAHALAHALGEDVTNRESAP